MGRNNYDYKSLLDEYGMEYLQEMSPDDCPYEMEMIDEMFKSHWDALRAAYFGYHYNPYSDGEHREEFKPVVEYFAFNAYANLVSIDKYDLDSWIESHIEEDEFIDWCVEQGYVEDYEPENDIEGVGLVSALQPRYDSRASFYGKAQIDDHDDHIGLYSFDTEVARFDKEANALEVFGYYSATTARHIREFARQLGITLPKGKDIEGVYYL